MAIEYGVTGYNGGSATGFHGGGGGGAGGNGGDVNSASAGDGGIGIVNNITGQYIEYAGGGGGGVHNNGLATSGQGKYGGGNGGRGSTLPTAGLANSGSGGGGGASLTNVGVSPGANGGSGIVIIRWKSDSTITPRYSMHSKGNIWMDGSSIVWTSDERIKKEVEDINDDDALQKVLSLQPKKYKYIDYMSRTNKEVYGFISQQVKEVIPEATSTTSSFIPNVYQFCNYTNSSNILTGKEESLIELPDGFDISVLSSEYNSSNLSTQVKIINNYNKSITIDYQLTDINSSNYGLVTEDLKEFSSNSSNIFVYGTQINDLTTIDKSYLFTLNVCANQELNRQVESLQLINSNLMERIYRLENELILLEQ